MQRSQGGLTTYEKWETKIPPPGTAGGQGGQATAVGASEKSPPLPKEIREIQFLESMSRLSSPPVWQPLRNRYHLKNAYLGSANGVHVYGNAAVWELVYVQKQLKLDGGEDWRRLAAEGILADDQTSSGSCIYLFKDADDDAVQVLTSVLSTRPDKGVGLYGALGQIRTKLATAKLIEGYGSRDKEVQRAAEYGLISPPLRPDAKSQYLAILAQKRYVDPIALTAVELGWTEALPALREVIAKPQGLGVLRTALDAERALSGREPPEEVERAFQILRTGPHAELAKAIGILAQYPDRELVAAHALSVFGLKIGGGDARFDAARKVLRSIPKQVLDSFRARVQYLWIPNLD